MTILICLIFALELWVGETQGDTDVIVGRHSRMLAAVFLLGAIVLAYVVLFARAAVKRGVFLVERTATPAFWILALWSAVAVTATVQGREAGFDPSYIVGDLFKFGLLTLLFSLVYFAIRTPKRLESAFKAYVVVFGCGLLLEFFLSYSWVHGGGRFTNSVSYHIATLVPLILYFFMTGAGGRVFRIALWFTSAETLLAIVLVQGLSDYLYLLLAGAVFLMYFRRKQLAITLIVAAGLACLGIQDPFGVFGARGSYADRKLQVVENSQVLSDAGIVEHLSGSRLAEVIAVGQAFQRSPQHLLTGFGMGSLIEALPLTEPNLARKILDADSRWLPVKHFIHSALAEVLFRTGVLGCAALLLFFVHLYYRGWKLARGPCRTYGRFAMANCVFQFCNLMIQSPLVFVWLILVLTLVGTYVFENATVRDAVAVRTGGLRSVKPASAVT